MREGIVHHMIDIVDPRDSYSVARFADEAKAVIAGIEGRGKVPIVAGGTGLYINALIYGYETSPFDMSLRSELIRELEERGIDSLYEELCRLDPISAQKIHKNNTKRVVRALEVFRITGKSLAGKTDRNEVTVPHLMYAVNVSRDTLYERINARVDEMFAGGLLAEVERLVNDEKLDFSMQSMQAIGYKEFKRYFDGGDIDDVKEDIKKHTRNYAKRQNTWFKAIPTCAFADYEGLTDRICREYEAFLRG
jgi:tRNA dimethylallyltransferase